eukprot:m.297063 g.297063  ORF g.297063 m.297063 type:complete len:1003 (+) comp16396_c0_seq4:1603-4611(+)
MEGIVCAVILHVVTSSPSPSPPSCSSPVHGVIIGFGNNLRNANAPSIDACCDACVKQKDCASWTYHNGMCYQHGAVTPTTKVAAAVSGIVPGRDKVLIGCFKDFVPAPGVPPVRALIHFNSSFSSATDSEAVQQCVDSCNITGYLKAGLTTSELSRNSIEKDDRKYWCYCGCQLNTNSPQVPFDNCSRSGVGANGFMSVYDVSMTPKSTPTCPGGALPPGPACSQKAAQNFSFCNTSLSLDARINDLVNRITLQEAGPLLTARQSPAIPRLGIPPFYWGTNAIHGIARVTHTCLPNDPLTCATSFPQSLNIGCTFNRSIARGVGRTIGREMRAFANLNLSADGLTSWSPTINIIRDPRWGRNQETVSEDPLVAGTYAMEFSLGMQYNRSASDATPPPRATSGEFMAVATLKHFTGYSLEQWSRDGNWTENQYDRTTFDANISLLDMESTYSQPFKKAIMGGGAAGVMYACNKVNGVPSVANPTLRKLLDSFSFDGYRTTDGDGINGMNDPGRQNYTSNQEDSILVALRDGESDIDDGGTYAEYMANAVLENKVNMTLLRRALYNTFRIRFRLGLFDPPSQQKWGTFDERAIHNEEAQTLNKDASRQSLVLLQNNKSTLPLPISTLQSPSKPIVIIGGSANSTVLLGGSYARTFSVVDGYTTGGFPAIPQAVKQVLHDNGNKRDVEWYPGMACLEPGRSSQICSKPRKNVTLLNEAVNAALEAHQVIIVVNLQSLSPCDAEGPVDGEFNPCGYEAEQHDRYSTALPRVQESLALAVLNATNNANIPTVVVLVHGGALSIETIKDKADAILDAHYPGVETGAMAIAETLYGMNNPSGKLTYTVFPTIFTNLSDFASMDMTTSPGRGYRYYPTSSNLPPVLWPFGWGLSYTNFSLSCSLTQMTVSCTVKNVGSRQGSEVVQLYHIPPANASHYTGAVSPHRILIDFQRVDSVEAGQTSKVNFLVTEEQFKLATSSGGRVLLPMPQTVSVSRGHGEEIQLTVDVSK